MRSETEVVQHPHHSTPPKVKSELGRRRGPVLRLLGPRGRVIGPAFAGRNRWCASAVRKAPPADFFLPGLPWGVTCFLNARFSDTPGRRALVSP